MKKDFKQILDKLEPQQPMSDLDGYRWGLGYLSTVIENLKELESKALKSNNFELLDKTILSMRHAKDVEQELKEKIASCA